jgi:hypothetical protein
MGQALVRFQLLQRIRRAVARQVGRAADDDLRRVAQLARHQLGRGQRAPAYRHVGALVQQVDHTVRQRDVQRNVREAFVKGRHQRQQQAMRGRHAGIDADATARHGAGGRAALGFVHVGQHARAVFVKRRAFGRELQLAGGAVDQPRIQSGLQPGDQLADRRGRHAQLARGGREAAFFHDLDKSFHFAGAVDVIAGHGWVFSGSKVRFNVNSIHKSLSSGHSSQSAPLLPH